MRLPRPTEHDFFYAGVIFFALAVCIVLLGGCSSIGTTTVPVSDGQAQAVDIIWRETYGRTDRPPLIRWKQGSQLDCVQPSGVRGFTMMEGDPSDTSFPFKAVCGGGLTLSPLDCIVAWNGEPSFSETALAHELWHVSQARALVSDPGHETPGFQHADWCQRNGLPVDHGECGIVDRANAALVAAGR